MYHDHVVNEDIKIQCGHRMSTDTPGTNIITDNTQTDSFFSNLKNKVTYNLHKAAYDPDANKFAETQKKQEEENKKNKKDTKIKIDSTDSTDAAGAADKGDPNKFSAKRLAKKVGNQTLDILQKIFYPFLALMLSMIVTNDMIMYSAPIRIIFFIFTFLVCFFAHTLAILLSIFYLFKGGYSYYINNMTNRPKRDIMPTIFALFPITTFKPTSSLGSFFMYPFTYPKTEAGANKLPEIMKNYWEDLKGSFKNLDEVKNFPSFTEKIKTVQEELEHLHNNTGSENATQNNSPIS